MLVEEVAAHLLLKDIQPVPAVLVVEVLAGLPLQGQSMEHQELLIPVVVVVVLEIQMVLLLLAQVALAVQAS
jgi:hypothetical protein